jgi:hypothetical protein
MKILEVTGFGNSEKHLIPLNNIINIHFEDRFTSIILAGGNKVNIIETESTIKEMLEYFESDIISEVELKGFWEGNGRDNIKWIDSGGCKNNNLPF